MSDAADMDRAIVDPHNCADDPRYHALLTMLRRGDPVHWAEPAGYPLANRDEEVFADPFAFRIDRQPARHLSFGYGPHVCLGQHLAKLEIRIVFEELLGRVDDFHSTDTRHRRSPHFASGLQRLPIRYAARS